MDKLRINQRKPSSKQAKPKKKPVKIVYISNPMKVKTSASEFRALVQELTGRDSDSGNGDMVGISEESNSTVNDLQRVPNQGSRNKLTNDNPLEIPSEDPFRDFSMSSASLSEPFDDVFTPQMLENFLNFLPSNPSYESSQVDEDRSLDG